MTVQTAPHWRSLHCHIDTVMHFLQSPTDIYCSNIQKLHYLIGYRSRKLKTFEVAGRSDSSPSESKGPEKCPGQLNGLVMRFITSSKAFKR